MAQHFRLNPLSRSLTLAQVGRMSDVDIATYFAKLRWGNAEQQVCPKCGSLDAHYAKRRRRRSCRRPCSSWEAPTNPAWQCKHCQAIFSITSGTLFDSTKLSLRAILNGALLLLGPGNGAAAIGMSALSGLNFKTVFLMNHRFREAMAADQPKEPFNGLVQIDGGYFGGKPRKLNRRVPKATRKQLQRRFGKEPIPKDEQPWKAVGLDRNNWRKMQNKRVVLAVANSGGSGNGARAVAVGVARGGENEYAVQLISRAHIVPGAMVMTDEAPAYNQLGREYEHYSVSHAREFSSSEGVNDNLCEAFFSRMRRAEYGIYHGYRPIFLHYYASEAAWRHTHRKMPKHEQVELLLAKALSLEPSIRLRGYYAKKGHRTEVLIDSETAASKRHSK